MEMTSEEFNRLMEYARKRVDEMDKIDGGEPTESLPLTAMFAVQAGLMTSDKDCLFDAIVYLERIASFKCVG